VHPIERLRYVARSRGDDQRALVVEAAGALRGLGIDHAGLVVAARRIVERHPTAGALWSLCAHLLTSVDPFAAARVFVADVESDPTPDWLADLLPDEATALVVGWPDLAGEALHRRGDVAALVVDSGDHAPGLVRGLDRGGSVADLVSGRGLGAAVLMADVVVVEAFAASGGELMVAAGSRAAASVAYCSEIPVWAVIGRGRCLPQPLFEAAHERALGSAAPWLNDVETMPAGLVNAMITDAGLVPAEGGSVGWHSPCALAPELIRPSPM
jgi:hypothetical protein